MGFIRLFPLPEIHPFAPDRFGYGDPARVRAIARLGEPEWGIGVREIVRHEDCPLYIVSPEEPNALVDGVRLQLRSGECRKDKRPLQEGAADYPPIEVGTSDPSRPKSR